MLNGDKRFYFDITCPLDPRSPVTTVPRLTLVGLVEVEVKRFYFVTRLDVASQSKEHVTW